MEKMEILGTHEKVAETFVCNYCNYITSKKYNYTKHLSTDKHKIATFTHMETGKVAKVAKHGKVTTYVCNHCDQPFKTNSGLWKHEKKCVSEHQSINLNVNEHVELTDKQLIMMLIKDNSEFKNMMIEQQKHMIELVKNGTHNTNNNNTNCGKMQLI